MVRGGIGPIRGRLVAAGMVLACALAAGCSEGEPVGAERGRPGAKVETNGLMVQELSNPF